jgi:hypothetical protein
MDSRISLVYCANPLKSLDSTSEHVIIVRQFKNKCRHLHLSADVYLFGEAPLNGEQCTSVDEKLRGAEFRNIIIKGRDR